MLLLVPPPRDPTTFKAPDSPCGAEVKMTRQYRLYAGSLSACTPVCRGGHSLRPAALPAQDALDRRPGRAAASLQPHPGPLRAVPENRPRQPEPGSNRRGVPLARPRAVTGGAGGAGAAGTLSLFEVWRISVRFSGTL